MKKFRSILLAFLALVLLAEIVPAQFGRNDYVALYRLFNSANNDHLYTTSCDEKESLTVGNSYIYEGIAGFVAARQSRRTKPLYRLLLDNGKHFYTTDADEVRQLNRNGKNRSEGVAGYLAENNERNTNAFYRLFSGDGKHFYTINETERSNFLRGGKSREEGVIGYLWASGEDKCGDGGGSSEDDYPVIYSRTDFTGASKTIEDDWNVNENWDGAPNAIRSIRVPAGWYVTIYARKNYRGKSFTMTNDAVFTTDNEWYNGIGSIKISRTDPRR